MATKEKTSTGAERAVGRRKTASARVQIAPGKGVITVNGKTLEEYFPVVLWREKVSAPLKLTGREGQLDISIKVSGGGVHAQAEAARHGISRALLKWNEDLRPVLRAEGYLTRDSRSKERKKPGKHKARRGHQWRKR